MDADVWEVSHHGSANGTNQAILDAITPQIATLGTGDPARTTGGAFTAFAFGHPREDAVDLILGSLTRKRPDIHVLAATGQRAFESIDLNEALYATGWDGTVVITGRSDGTWHVQRSDREVVQGSRSSRPSRTSAAGKTCGACAEAGANRALG